MMVVYFNRKVAIAGCDPNQRPSRNIFTILKTQESGKKVFLFIDEKFFLCFIENI